MKKTYRIIATVDEETRLTTLNYAQENGDGIPTGTIRDIAATMLGLSINQQINREERISRERLSWVLLGVIMTIAAGFIAFLITYFIG